MTYSRVPVAQNALHLSLTRLNIPLGGSGETGREQDNDVTSFRIPNTTSRVSPHKSPVIITVPGSHFVNCHPEGIILCGTLLKDAGGSMLFSENHRA